MTQLKRVHIVSTTDNEYVQHLAAAYVSVLYNLSPEWSAKFYVIDGGIEPDYKTKLVRSVQRLGGSIEFLTVHEAAYNEFETRRHITPSTFFRLSIPDLIQSHEIDKVIYLDCDLIVLDDISKLWMTDLAQYPVAAVGDIGGSHRFADLNIPPESKYFNSGVLLINLPQWRQESVTAQVIDFIKNNPDKMYYHDQDGLNAVLHAKWLELDPRWNIQRNMLALRNKRQQGNALMALAVREPAVIHFTGTPKPWHYHDNHAFKHQYYKYLALTEWGGFRPTIGPLPILKKIVKKLLPESVSALLINLKRSR